MKTLTRLKKRATVCFSFLLVTAFAALPLTAEAAVSMPPYDRLTPMTDRIEAPSDVAVDQFGDVYIAETNEDRVTVLSQSGRYTGLTIKIEEPLSVAVDSSGRILIGSKEDGSVSVYSPAGGYLFQFGKGKDEFGKPTDIAIDSTGKVYVVDKENDIIRTFTITNTAASEGTSIGTPGNGDGQLHHPIGIAIDENAGEIVVLDRQQILDSAGTRKMVDGVRIQYFDLNGVSLRAYSKFGYNNAGMISIPEPPWMKTIYDISMGQMTKPNRIAVDALSRVYVTDARLQKVMVYDNHDTWLGTIDSTTKPLRIPQGIFMGASGRLYVASLFTHQVEVFGIDDYTALIATPATVEFNAVENGTSPAAKSVKVKNLGKASMALTVTASEGWISASAATSTLLSKEETTLDISVDSTGLAPGKHTGSVAVDTGAGAAETVKVVLTVASNPLKVIPGSLEFTTSVGTTAQSQALKVTGGKDALLFDVSADQSWITLNKYTGVTPATVRVYADTTSLDPGTYTATITFVQQGSNPAPVDVPVTLTLSEDGSDPGKPPVIGKKGATWWNKRWTVKRILPGTDLDGVTGTTRHSVMAVGDDGAIISFNGKKWSKMNSGTDKDLNKAWSVSRKDVYAVGAEGTALNYDGTNWTTAAATGKSGLMDIWGVADTLVTVDEFGAVYEGSSFTASGDLGVALRTVWGSSNNDVLVAGEAGAIFQYDGTEWTAMTSGTTEWLNSMWGSSSTDVFAVGENGVITHYDGTEWTVMESGTEQNLNGICGVSGHNVYAVGDDSLILHYNGDKWSALEGGVDADLNDAWCSRRGDVYAVGDDGTIIRGKARKFPWTRVIQQISVNADKLRQAKNAPDGEK